MKTKFKWLIIPILLICLILLGLGIQINNSYADFINDTEKKIICEANINDSFSDDSVLVTFKKNIPMSTELFTDEDLEDIECKEAVDLMDISAELIDKDNFRRVMSLSLKERSKENVLKVIKRLEKRGDVLAAEPNYIGRGNAFPNSEMYDDESQWGLNGKYGIQASAAWDIATGSASIIVGVMDTGIDSTHPDLKNHLCKADALSSYQILSRDFTTDVSMGVEDLYSSDPNGHGTHIAGIIGAQWNNAKSVSGVCWDVRLASLKIMDAQKRFLYRHAINAINFAAIYNIPILSFSGAGTDPISIAFTTAVDNYTGLIVTSSGNEGEDNDKTIRYPSDFSDEKKTEYSAFSNRVISVGAITKTGSIWENSNYGANTVSLFAPGVDIKSTIPKNKYGNWSGTSMATPFVTGVAALMLSVNNQLTAAEIKSIICDTVDYDKQLSNLCVSGGRLNAYNAVKYVAFQDKACKVMLDDQQGVQDVDHIIAYIGEPMPQVSVPVKSGYIFHGYFSGKNGTGTLYYDENMMSVNNWNSTQTKTLYAYWTPRTYPVTISYKGLYPDQLQYVTYGKTFTVGALHSRKGYDFEGLYTGTNGSGTQYVKGDVILVTEGYMHYTVVQTGVRAWDINSESKILYINWKPLVYNDFQILMKDTDGKLIGASEKYTVTHGVRTSFTAAAKEGYKFVRWETGSGATSTSSSYSCTIDLERTYDRGYISSNTTLTAIYEKTDECIAEGTLITLADGRQVPVESLTGSEQLLVWNLKTGQFDSAPILFIDREARTNYSVLNLAFSDGTAVKVIGEHGFWDCNLNQYVYLRQDNAQDYIGHIFKKQSGEGLETVWSEVQLVSATVSEETTAAYSPVTAEHLCYFVNGMLSMPGGIEGLFNIFEADSETMRYDETLMAADIARYGLFTYEEFSALVPVSEEMFEVFGGQYLKVALGKGLITEERLQYLAGRYAPFFAE